jgi:hypothetical protein
MSQFRASISKCAPSEQHESRLIRTGSSEREELRQGNLNTNTEGRQQHQEHALHHTRDTVMGLGQVPVAGKVDPALAQVALLQRTPVHRARAPALEATP